jgi:AcrR family transcriptional regulator
MPTDAELTFADHAGRLYARRYGFPPMVGRLIGYLSVRHPEALTIAELADALLASRSAISNAVKTLEQLRVAVRSRAAGEQNDRVRLDLSSSHALGFDTGEYVELRELANEGLEVLADAPVERRALLLELAAFSDFLIEKMPELEKAWVERRDALVASGELPGADATGGRS